MNLLYSSKIVCKAVTNASSFRYSGGVAGVSKIDFERARADFRRRIQDAFVAVADDAVARGKAIDGWPAVARQELFRRRQRRFDQAFGKGRAMGEAVEAGAGVIRVQ